MHYVGCCTKRNFSRKKRQPVCYQPQRAFYSHFVIFSLDANFQFKAILLGGSSLLTQLLSTAAHSQVVSAVASILWNCLPEEFRQASNLMAFQRVWKTKVFMWTFGIRSWGGGLYVLLGGLGIQQSRGCQFDAL